MRIAIVTESFLPTFNGVTTSVCLVLDELAAAGGHDVVVIGPGPAPTSYLGFRVVTVPSVTVRAFRVGLPTPRLERVLREVAPDVVHVVSPFGLGARALAVSERLGLPSVAAYQTDMPAYLAQHGGPVDTPAACSRGPDACPEYRVGSESSRARWQAGCFVGPRCRHRVVRSRSTL